VYIHGFSATIQNYLPVFLFLLTAQLGLCTCYLSRIDRWYLYTHRGLGQGRYSHKSLLAKSGYVLLPSSPLPPPPPHTVHAYCTQHTTHAAHAYGPSFLLFASMQRSSHTFTGECSDLHPLARYIGPLSGVLHVATRHG